jgi:Domain of unknown function (DUF6968)
MIAFRVSLNGKKLATAGLPGRHAVSAIISSVVRTDRAIGRAARQGGKLSRRELDLHLSGLLSREDGSGAFVDWVRHRLRVGDTIALQIVDVKRPDEPAARRPFSAKQGRATEVPAPPRLRPVVAVRRLRVRGSRRSVLVRLGTPRPSGRDWRAPFEIQSGGRSEILYGYGVDAIQALINALEGVRVTLARSRRHLSWIGGHPGDPGFPRLVPDIGAPELRVRLERLIDQEVGRFVRALERKRRRRQRHGASATRRPTDRSGSASRPRRAGG